MITQIIIIILTNYYSCTFFYSFDSQSKKGRRSILSAVKTGLSVSGVSGFFLPEAKTLMARPVTEDHA
jgi:hypothetical protein